MHQTTVRFERDLWLALEHEAGLLGISIAQYVRESALDRLRHEGSGVPLASAYVAQAREAAALDVGPGGPGAAAASAIRRSAATLDDSSALWAQAQQARARAAELRAQRRGPGQTHVAEARAAAT